MHLVCRHRHSDGSILRGPLLRAASFRLRTFSHGLTRKQNAYPAANILGGFEPRAQPNPQAKNIAILGGGVTGLATAYNLSKHIPDAKITLYESKDRLGGWVDSEVAEVDDGRVLFEWGPRTLRPDYNGPGRATLNLVSPASEKVVVRD